MRAFAVETDPAFVAFVCGTGSRRMVATNSSSIAETFDACFRDGGGDASDFRVDRLPLGEFVADLEATQSWIIEAMRRAELGPGGVVPLSSDNGLVTSALLVYPRRDEVLEPRVLDLIADLATAMMHACQATISHAERAVELRSLREVVDSSKMGLIIVTDTGAVFFANAIGASAIEGRNAEVFVASEAPPDRRATVQAAFDRAMERTGEFPEERLVYRRELRSGVANGSPHTAYMLVEAAGVRPIPPEWLAKRYALTPAEARLTSLLAHDRSLEEAAEDLSIKLSTARTRLKKVFAKTGTNRQASLVARVMSELPMVPDPSWSIPDGDGPVFPRSRSRPARRRGNLSPDD